MDLTYPTFLVFELNTAKYVLTSLVPTVLVGHTNFSENRKQQIFISTNYYEFYIYKKRGVKVPLHYPTIKCSIPTHKLDITSTTPNGDIPLRNSPAG